LWVAKGAAPTGKKARKAKRKQITATVDGRSLKATGRTEQFNFRVRADVKARAQEAAAEAGMSIAEWLELAIEMRFDQGNQEATQCSPE
jgi:predicted HicB family RNase H-like nuclease